MRISEHLPTIRPINGQEEYAELSVIASRDDHKALFPTHIIRKGEEIAGYLSLGPYTTIWLHSQKVELRDTLCIFVAMDALLAQIGLSRYVLIVSPNSPFVGKLDHFGFGKSLGESSHYMKEL